VRAPALWRTAPVLFFHGGGYVCGSLEGTRGVAAALSTALAAPVLAVLYRQAPEQPFPAAVDDALASYRWLVQSQADAVLLAGESAGAALAVTAALRAAGTGLRPARGVIAVSGVFDLGFAGESWEINAEQDLITRATGEFLYGLYLAGHEPRDPLASPVHADFRRSPPLLIQAGGAEVLLDDSRRLVQKARTDGAHVSFQIYAGMPHNFTKFRGPLADAALAAMARWERGLHCRAQ
jgi:acetyl esterase/lipase